MATISSRDFNQDVGRAKRAARLEPVLITDRGRPTHVLLSFESYRELTGKSETIVDLLAYPDIAPADPAALPADAEAAEPDLLSWDLRDLPP